MNNLHTLKLQQPFFNAVLDGFKMFEVRRNDRDFKVDDYLCLEEFDYEKRSYTGRFINKRIAYITDYKQRKGYVVFSFKD